MSSVRRIVVTSTGPGVKLALASNAHVIRIGLLADEPIRLEGLTTMFGEQPQPGRPQLVPVVGELKDLLANAEVEYLVVDINASPDGLKTLEAVKAYRAAHPA